jgi:hypothetical protein
MGLILREKHYGMCFHVKHAGLTAGFEGRAWSLTGAAPIG